MNTIQFETNGLTVLAVIIIIALIAIISRLIKKKGRLKIDLLKSEHERTAISEKYKKSIKKEFRLGDQVYVHKDEKGYFGRDDTRYWIYEFYYGLHGDYLAKISTREDWEEYARTTSSLSLSNAIKITDISHDPVECCTKCGKPL